MQSDSAPPPGSPSDPAGGAPTDDTNPEAGPQATVAASLSSFRGLVGSTGDSTPGRPPGAPDGSTIATSGGVRFDPSQATAVGQMLGRYEIRKILGAGSMGSVFLAHDSQLHREVALKVPRLERDMAGELSQRLHREARAAATLNHPNICPIYDVTDHGGTCFIAMGYVSGKPLSAYLGKKVQPEREVAKVVRKIALALEEAHAQGIVHRDLKPSNIMIDKRGEPIVMDFGVACWFDDRAQTRLTQQGALVGTPAYMSPEQIEGKAQLGPASDIYSLGVVLYEMLTGRCPFQGTVLNVISQVLHQTAPDPRELRPDLSTELIEIVQRAMRKNPAERFTSMRDFAKALTAFLNRPSREETASEAPPRKTALPVEARQPASAKLSRIRREPPPAPLPRIKRAPAKKKEKASIPIGYGVAAATVLVIGGALIGGYVVSNRSTPKVAAVDQHTAVATDPAAGNAATTAFDGAVASTDSATTAPKPIASSSHVAKPGGANSIAPPLARKSNDGPNSGAAVAADASQEPVTRPAVAAPNVSTPTVARSNAARSNAARSDVARSNVARSNVARSDAARSNVARDSGMIPPNTAQTPPQPANSGVGPQGRPLVAGPGGAVARPSPRGDAVARQSPRGDASKSATPPAPPNEGPEPSDSPPPPRGKPPRPNGGPPGEMGQGPAPFDGGPQKGTSIEQYFKKIDTNSDGRIDPTELPLHIINRADTNKDGELTLAELKKAFKRLGQKLFGPPTAAEMRRLPGGRRPPFGGPPGGPPNGPPPGGQPGQGSGL